MHARRARKGKKREDKERKIKARSRAEFSKALSSQQVFLFSKAVLEEQGLDYSWRQLSFIRNLPPPIPHLS